MVSALPAGKQSTGGGRGNEQFQLNPGMSDLSEIAAAHCVLTTELHVIAENNRINKHHLSFSLKDRAPLSPLPAEDCIQLELSIFLSSPPPQNVVISNSLTLSSELRSQWEASGECAGGECGAKTSKKIKYIFKKCLIVHFSCIWFRTGVNYAISRHPSSMDTTEEPSL